MTMSVVDPVRVKGWSLSSQMTQTKHHPEAWEFTQWCLEMSWSDNFQPVETRVHFQFETKHYQSFTKLGHLAVVTKTEPDTANRFWAKTPCASGYDKMGWQGVCVCDIMK